MATVSIIPGMIVPFSYYARSGKIQQSQIQIGKKIADGGMAVVHHATILPTEDGQRISYPDTQVAVKIFDPHSARTDDLPGLLQRFQREEFMQAQVLREHENTIQFLGSGLLLDRRPFHVLELHRGRSLKTVISNRCRALEFLRVFHAENDDVGYHYGSQDTDVPDLQGIFLPEDLILQVGLCISSALSHAHRNGIVHRDVKPANVLLRVGEGHTASDVRLTDFGISKLIGYKSQDDRTKTKSVLGSFFYMSLEQIRGKRGIGFQADVFSLGAILYELVTGRRIVGQHPDLSDAGYIHEHMTILERQIECLDPAKHVPQVSQGLRDVIMIATQRDPMDRYSDGAAFHEALLKLTPHVSTGNTLANAETIYPLPSLYDERIGDSDFPPPPNSDRQSDSDAPTPVPSAPRLPARVFPVPAPDSALPSIHAPQAKVPKDLSWNSRSFSRAAFVGILALSLGAGAVFFLWGNPKSTSTTVNVERKQKAAKPLAPLPSASVRPPLPAENITPLEKNNKYHFGLALMKQKQLKEARENFLDALQLTPNAPEIYRKLAEVSRILGQKADEKAYLDKASALEQVLKK